MIFDIDHQEDQFVIKFKAKDINAPEYIECIRHTCYGLAHSFCFEANSLFSGEFTEFLNSLAPRRTYCVVVGRDRFNQEPIVEWGIFNK